MKFYKLQSKYQLLVYRISGAGKRKFAPFSFTFFSLVLCFVSKVVFVISR